MFKHILVHDWETSGLPHEKDFDRGGQGIQYGAIVVDAETLETVDEILLNIHFHGKGGGAGRFPGLVWEETAEAIHGLTREWLDANGVDIMDAGEAFDGFVRKYWQKGERILSAGHNPSFDKHFTFQLAALSGFEENIRFHHRMIDTFSIGYLLLGAENSDQLFEKVGVVRGKHDALEDARACLAVLRHVRHLRDKLSGGI